MSNYEPPLDPPEPEGICLCAQCREDVRCNEVVPLGRYGEPVHIECIGEYVADNYSSDEIIDIFEFSKIEVSKENLYERL